ncbi:hypothetical protein BLNAU_13070 [Blattamonas nauphoetae]|uniref:Uncharacterized protein n=1 Tax=Blattamonas nauphoetae TaxID=2049346 RepID=A0ABQ9XPB8_9EUKA|nr:hypothetical protein BLNAU_13070 [Blattamonas nauphoetae]
MERRDIRMEVENTADSTDKPIMTASFDSEKAGTSTGWLYPTAELKFGGRYRIVSVEFSIDATPARLTGLTPNLPSNEHKELRLSLTVIGMTNGRFTIELSPAGSLSARFTDGTSGSSNGILFSTNEEVSQLNYSTRYKDRATSPT